MKRRILVFLALGVFVVAAVQIAYAARTVRSVTMAGLVFGPSHNAQHQAFNGYYDGHQDEYYNTDVSKKKQAKKFHVNYAPVLSKAYPKATSPMYFVKGAAANNQEAVFGSEPGDKDYSPLWQEIIVHWKSGVTPVLLTSDNQIFAQQKKGKLTLKHTKKVLNAPITKVEGKAKS